MKPKFASKEFAFLKPDSDGHPPIQAPGTYFSDLVHQKTVSFTAFEQRLSSAAIPKNTFVCAVIQVAQTASESIREKARDIFEACFHSVLDKKRGIWESLDPTAFVLVFWDYDNRQKAMDLLESLKSKITHALKTELLVGVAMFPFHDFSRSQVFANALKAIDHAAFFGPGHMRHFDGISLNISGDRLYQLEQYDAAIIEYEQGLALEPKNINLMNSLGVCFGVTGELEKAKKLFKDAIKINPGEIMVIYNLGLIHQILDNMDKAVFFLRKAHGIDGSIFEVELLLGHLLFQAKKSDQAIPHLETASRVNPESSMAFRIMGEIFLERQNLDKAGAAFNTAVKLKPADPIALSGYALAMALRKRNLKIALTFAQKSVDLEPENTIFQERLQQVKQLTQVSKNQDKTKKFA
ncbi:MAG: tetratricopeptide repeat protein [Desulfotignum sp.]|nr:tetratricopeptide repeat protein [Desulfotignum sp.]MCF8112391.1 tetratricopeptide repeat protein [Desulfotignum sp.]MCF8125223.1 tetratricopeptide repeat protein [Desulfotignum sp.]